MDEKNHAEENFVSEKDAAWFAGLYREKGLTGGHVILLNPSSSEFFEETKKQALLALKSFPGGLQAGGGITAENAGEYLEAGASHVIVTSYVFRDGGINYENLEKLKKTVGKEHIVDVEGKADGIEENVARLLGSFGKKSITYAGGVHSFEDLELLKRLGRERVDVTIGSALSLFGGTMEFEEVLRAVQ